ncbi:MAG TPA: HAMP domain-containing sensor histidine kinase [Vicinamibacterales bacterium]|nr:HAMP domain-containing sensor histidine kinase [Vicinamibacterales bacterium]
MTDRTGSSQDTRGLSAVARSAKADRVSAARIFAGGCAVAAAVVLIGFLVEFYRLGTSDAMAAASLEQDVRAQFTGMTDHLVAVAQHIARDPEVAGAMGSDTADADTRARTLFDVAARDRDSIAGEAADLAVTVYDASGAPKAWAGRASDLPPERTKTSAASLFVAPSPLGLRLVYLEPIGIGTRARAGAVAAEDVLTAAPPASILLTTSSYEMTTTRGNVTLRVHHPGDAPPADRQDQRHFQISAPDGTPLLDASVSFLAVAGDREEHRRAIAGLALSIFAVTILLLTGPLLDRRATARDAPRELVLTFSVVAVVVAGGLLAWFAFRVSPWYLASGNRKAMKLLLSGSLPAALAAACVSAAVRLRVAIRSRRRWPDDELMLFAGTQLAAGILIAALLAVFEIVLGRSVDPAAVDLRHFSLHPWTTPRLATLAGILLGHAALLWSCSLCAVMALSRWRLPRQWSSKHVIASALWLLPTIAIAALGTLRGWPVPPVAVVLGAVASTLAALVGPRLAEWYRRAPVVSRLVVLFMAFLVPALLVYPSVQFFGERSIRHLIETQYAVEAMQHPQTLQSRLHTALEEISALPSLDALVATAAGGPPSRRTDTAFRIWSQTVLARERLTSDVEIYDATGVLVPNPFALNFPSYAVAVQKLDALPRCDRWETSGEAPAVGVAQDRNMLRAQRGVCRNGVVRGAIVVHVALDYRTLPFITSPSGYFDVFSASGSRAPIEGAPAGDVDVVIYGWGLTAIYMSANDAWPLDQETFHRIYTSARTPFWTVLSKGKTRDRVYFTNDRQFIYAIGYPIPGVFDHFVRIAELTTLAAVGYVLILLGSAAFSRLARVGPRTGRALLREIRASFYRKLFIAFVLASIVPVLTLAFVIRAYFANLLMSDIQGEASRTAAVAARVIEESDALLRAQGATPFGDDVMVWISQLINQDVNVFDGPELSVTSERDLFESGLLPTRTPDDVYRAIVLQRLPSFVTQDQSGVVPYILAATPIRTGGRNALLTVPLAFRQHEVEREIDDLDRGVHLAALFFILVGAGIGLSMAERIADPVRQLTRATRRIARGDFDARIAVRSADELRRLVDAFNGMAAELKAQRDQLERTHRLEAWAEMARQVAHEIKNPLTPIQLSAEHLQRVHADRGQPMSPVLESCVSTILGQVRLLRQIAAEFSSFASSPTARRAPADPVRLVADVVEPYRVGLGDRIQITNDVRPPLPQVIVDRRLVARALANIVENALHAMPGDGRLHLTSHVDDGFVQIRIEDTGVGMDEEALARVFEPYFSTKTTGTGLGLPIARRNVELSGGNIAVDSERGRGTAVTIRLPVADQSPSAV